VSTFFIIGKNSVVVGFGPRHTAPRIVGAKDLRHCVGVIAGGGSAVAPVGVHCRAGLVLGEGAPVEFPMWTLEILGKQAGTSAPMGGLDMLPFHCNLRTVSTGTPAIRAIASSASPGKAARALVIFARICASDSGSVFGFPFFNNPSAVRPLCGCTLLV
jgi:hypothetical protein